MCTAVAWSSLLIREKISALFVCVCVGKLWQGACCNKHENRIFFKKLFINASLIRFITLTYIPSPPSLSVSLSRPLRSNAFLLSHLIQFIIVGPPLYTQLSGETKALPNMDVFLFPWICAALPWGYCTPISPYTHTHTHPPSFSYLTHIQEDWKNTWGCSLCHLFHGWKWHSGRMETEHSHSGVMLIECKSPRTLKRKWRTAGRY